jgi:hypothetical protein
MAPGVCEVEFIDGTEALNLLKEQGVVEMPEDSERVHLTMEPTTGDVVRVHLATAGTSASPAPGADVITMEPDRLPEAIDGIVQKLHLSQILLVPVSKWRHLFDAVAFSLADNEDWQRIDTTATVELNSRDPLLCEPGDFHTVAALMRALIADGEHPEQGLMLTATSVPLLLEIVPDGAVRMSFGTQVLADEAAEAIAARR